MILLCSSNFWGSPLCCCSFVSPTWVLF
uniref:Uncharacterized protein n=1 Tax=Rhizophora mucronata TaxID=61149 RepID=A0A2P2PN04_RHIMU